MAEIGNYLFSGDILREKLGSNAERMSEKIAGLPRGYLENADPGMLAENIASQFKVKAIKLNLSMADSNSEDIRVNIDDYGRTVPVDGILITFLIPFEGDEDLFRYKPDDIVLSSFIKGELNNNTLLLKYKKRRAADALENIRSEYDRDISIINRNLDSMQASISSFNDSILQGALNMITERISRIRNDSEEMERQGFPRRRNQ